MTRIRLGENAKEEIREAIKRCRTSHEVAAEVAVLADHFNVGKDRIYAITKDLRSPRKSRSDKGNCKLDINSDPNLRLAVGRVLEYGITTAEALHMAALNGQPVDAVFTTVNRYMQKAGLSKQERRTPTTPHKRFEAKAPGEMYQFDISGVKQRWFDHSTRKIVHVPETEVSKNHPNEKLSRVQVWRFALIDDHSRRMFVRYYAVRKPSSSFIVDFLLRAYSEMGIPKILYSDNDKVIKYARNQRATEILNKSLADQGGYKQWFHLAGNSRATGKVERLHQTIESLEKFIGIYIDQGRTLTVDDLNARLAPGIMHRLNVLHVHSETNQTPMARWENTLSVVRTLSYEDIKSAFMADEFTAKLRGDLTFKFKGTSYQLPTSEMYPFAAWIGQKLRIVFPDNQPFFTVIGLDDIEYDIDKQASEVLTAGQSSRSLADVEGTPHKLRKELKKLAKQDAKESIVAIPYFDEELSEVAAAPGVIRFPKPEIPIDIERVEREAPGRVAAHDPAINFWEAVPKFQQRFASKAECKSFMDTLFESREAECWLLLSEVESAVEARSSDTHVRSFGHLKAVG